MLAVVQSLYIPLLGLQRITTRFSHMTNSKAVCIGRTEGVQFDQDLGQSLYMSYPVCGQKRGQNMPNVQSYAGKLGCVCDKCPIFSADTLASSGAMLYPCMRTQRSLVGMVLVLGDISASIVGVAQRGKVRWLLYYAWTCMMQCTRYDVVSHCRHNACAVMLYQAVWAKDLEMVPSTCV